MPSCEGIELSRSGAGAFLARACTASGWLQLLQSYANWKQSSSLNFADIPFLLDRPRRFWHYELRLNCYCCRQDLLMITKKRKKNIRDPEGTKADILAVAQQEFANKGLHGARIDTISARTKTTKRGIYYYFGGKSQLYAAVIERAYVELMQSEANLLIGDSDPREALKRIAEFIFDFFDDHPDFIRLLITENIHEARYVK